jgi:hypothetical protein
MAKLDISAFGTREIILVIEGLLTLLLHPHNQKK